MFKSSALAGGFFVYIVQGEFAGLGCWFTSYMGRGEFFRLRRSAKWPPRLFLRAKVVRRLPRRSDIVVPCWCSLSASPAGGRFTSAGEKSRLFPRYCCFGAHRAQLHSLRFASLEEIWGLFQKDVDNGMDSSYNISCDYGMWHSLVARIVRDDEAAGSNPVIPTIEIISRQLWLAAFLFTS